MILASDTVWTALIGGVFGLATAVVGAFVAVRTHNAKVNNDASDAKVAEMSDRMDPLVGLAATLHADALAAQEDAKAAREEARVARIEARNEHAIAAAFESRVTSQEIELRYLRDELRLLRAPMGNDGPHGEADRDPV